MYIKRLHVKGFRRFKELNVEFNKGFNFIIGRNGCGKTSLLRAITLAYSDNQMQDSRYDDDFCSWIDLSIHNSISRIGLIPDNTYNKINKGYRAFQSITFSKLPPKDGVNNVYYTRDAAEIRFCPLVLGAFRRIEYREIQGMNREKNVIDSIKEYIANAANSLNGGILPNVKQWMINRYFQIDKEWAYIEKQNWDWLIDNLNQLSTIDNKFEFESIERDLEPKFKINGEICYLEELSSGFQSILSIVLSIFEWIEKTHEGEERLVRHANGTVIIDEIDVHLHPEWQLNLKKSLETIFPNLQFIVTTHSPHIIATADPGEILILDNIVGNTLVPNDKSYNGWNTDQILDEIMGVKSLSNKLYKELISESMKLIEEKDTNALENTLKKLEEIVHPSDTIVSVLKIKLAELRLGDYDD